MYLSSYVSVLQITLMTISSLTLMSCQKEITRDQRGVYLSPSQDIQLGLERCHKDAQAQTWSVIIGINRYLDPGIPQLKGAAQDAWNVYHYLTHRDGAGISPSRSKLLINEEATKVNVEEALGEFLTQACPRDQVVIYFAGHGAPEPDRPDDAFLLVHDTTLSRLVSTGLSMNQLPKFLTWRANQAGRLIFLVDACHSGVIQFPGSRGITLVNHQSKSIEKLRAESLLNSLSKISSKQSGWGVLSSSAPDQLSGEGSGECFVGSHRYQGGLFTCALLNSIQANSDTDGDQVLSYNELFDSVSDHLTDLRGAQQTPQRSGDLDGRSPLFNLPKRPVPIPPIAKRYVDAVRTKSYRPWIYSSLAAATISLGFGLYYQGLANDRSSELNGFLNDELLVKSSERYQADLNDRQDYISRSKWSYLGAAALSLGLSALSTLEIRSGPPPINEAYLLPPLFYIGEPSATSPEKTSETQKTHPKLEGADHEMD